MEGSWSYLPIYVFILPRAQRSAARAPLGRSWSWPRVPSSSAQTAGLIQLAFKGWLLCKRRVVCEMDRLLFIVKAFERFWLSFDWQITVYFWWYIIFSCIWKSKQNLQSEADLRGVSEPERYVGHVAFVAGDLKERKRCKQFIARSLNDSNVEGGQTRGRLGGAVINEKLHTQISSRHFAVCPRLNKVDYDHSRSFHNFEPTSKRMSCFRFSRIWASKQGANSVLQLRGLVAGTAPWFRDGVGRTGPGAEIRWGARSLQILQGPQLQWKNT